MTKAIQSVEELEQLLSEPTQPVVEIMRRLHGDIILLGAAGITASTRRSGKRNGRATSFNAADGHTELLQHRPMASLDAARLTVSSSASSKKGMALSSEVFQSLACAIHGINAFRFISSPKPPDHVVFGVRRRAQMLHSPFEGTFIDPDTTKWPPPSTPP